MAADVFSAARSGDVAALLDILDRSPAPPILASAASGKQRGGRATRVASSTSPRNVAPCAPAVERNDEGATALHLAASSGSLECVRALLARGADLLARDAESSYTPLHRALLCGHAGVALALVDAGAPHDEASGIGLLRRVRLLRRDAGGVAWRARALAVPMPASAALASRRSTVSASGMCDREGFTPLDLATLRAERTQHAVRQSYGIVVPSPLLELVDETEVAAADIGSESGLQKLTPKQRRPSGGCGGSGGGSGGGSRRSKKSRRKPARRRSSGASDDAASAAEDSGMSSCCDEESSISTMLAAGDGDIARGFFASPAVLALDSAHVTTAPATTPVSPPSSVRLSGNVIMRPATAASATDNAATWRSAVLSFGRSRELQLGYATSSEVQVAPRALEVEAAAVRAGAVIDGAHAAAIHISRGATAVLLSTGDVLVCGTTVGQRLGLPAVGPAVIAPVLHPAFGPRARAPVAALSLGTKHALAVGCDGGLWAWGENKSGACGTGSSDGGAAVPVPRRVEGGGLRRMCVVAAAAGGHHSVAICSDGSLFAWGSNLLGQLGMRDAPCLASLVAAGGSAAGTAEQRTACVVWQPRRMDAQPFASAISSPSLHSRGVAFAYALGGGDEENFGGGSIGTVSFAAPLDASGSGGAVGSDALYASSARRRRRMGLALPPHPSLCRASALAGSPPPPAGAPVAVAASDGYTLVLNTAGEVAAVGLGSPVWGRLAFDSVAASESEAAAAAADAAAWLADDGGSCAGSSPRTRPAAGGDKPEAVPVADVVAATTAVGRIVHISASRNAALAIDEDGGAWVWADPAVPCLSGAAQSASTATGATALVPLCDPDALPILMARVTGGVSLRSAVTGAGAVWPRPARQAALWRAGVAALRGTASLHAVHVVAASGDVFAWGDGAAEAAGLLGPPPPPNAPAPAPSWVPRRLPAVKGALDVAASDQAALVVTASVRPPLPPLRPLPSDIASVVRWYAPSLNADIRIDLMPVLPPSAATPAPGAASLGLGLALPPAPAEAANFYREAYFGALRRVPALAPEEVYSDLLRDALVPAEEAADALSAAAALSGRCGGGGGALASADEYSLLPPLPACGEGPMLDLAPPSASGAGAGCSGGDSQVSRRETVIFVPSLRSLCERALAAQVTLANAGTALALAEDLGADGLATFVGALVSANLDALLASGFTAGEAAVPAAGAVGSGSNSGGTSNEALRERATLVDRLSGLTRGRWVSPRRQARLRRQEASARAATDALAHALHVCEMDMLRPARVGFGGSTGDGLPRDIVGVIALDAARTRMLLFEEDATPPVVRTSVRSPPRIPTPARSQPRSPAPALASTTTPLPALSIVSEVGPLEAAPVSSTTALAPARTAWAATSSPLRSPADAPVVRSPLAPGLAAPVVARRTAQSPVLPKVEPSASASPSQSLASPSTRGWAPPVTVASQPRSAAAASASPLPHVQQPRTVGAAVNAVAPLSLAAILAAEEREASVRRARADATEAAKLAAAARTARQPAAVSPVKAWGGLAVAAAGAGAGTSAPVRSLAAILQEQSVAAQTTPALPAPVAAARAGAGKAWGLRK